MKKILLIIFVVLIPIWALFYTNLAPVFSDELDEINKEIAELQQALEASKKATVPLESQLNNLTTRLNSIQARVSAIEVEIEVKRQNIAKGYLELGEQQQSFNLIVKNSYIKTYSLSPLLLFFSSDDPGEFIKFLTYQMQDAERDKSEITSTALKLVDLEERKAKLEGEEKTLAGLKSTLDKERAEIEEIVLGAKAYQSDLSGQIATLTARQNEIINARSGGFTATIGDSELADDYNASIKGFRESAPSGYFAVFSFGAHTHRKGMSQYGARGRAQSGQNSNQILQAYYGKEPVDKDTNGTIKVAGQGEIDFEGRYLLGIAEMPSSWHPEALKAQAIAARTYAYRYKVQGSEICTTEACQVFNSGKADNPPDSWRQAVESTRGKVLEDVVTYYASTHGGFADPIGWDTTDGSGGGNFTDKAYDKIGGSPWLYKSWYTKGYSTSSDKCGRSNPWLSPEELADIVNAAIALRTSGIDTGRITPVTTSCWGGNPYSMDELKNLVAGNGGISNATSVSVSQGNGSTGTVVINGVSLSGSEFKKAFNLRAPGYLSIPQSSFAFFNIEKK
jgi:peptidoglycan hydrolase CwlO-like protein